MNEVVTVVEAATFLHKHPGTIRRWIEEGKLKAKHISAGGHGVYAILRNDLLEFMVAQSVEEKEKAKHAPHHREPPSPQRPLPL